MIYSKISNQDWTKLKELAAEFANYADESEVDLEICRTRILDYLKALDLQYGPHPRIYDSMADYLPEEEDSLPLRLKAFELCAESDYLEKILISKSIAEYYIEKANKTAANSWASKALSFAKRMNNTNETDEINKLIKKIEAS